MTPEQTAHCSILAKRIAELDPRWPKLGMACHDGERLWRRTHTNDLGWPGWTDGKGVRAWQDEDGDNGESVRTAIQNGPAWDDVATAGVILLGLGEEVVLERVHTQFKWVVGWFWKANWRNDKNSSFHHQGPLRETPQEAVLAARLVQLGDPV